MDKENRPPALPEKVLRRQAELVVEILPEIARLVTEEKRPADVLLARYLRTHKELGSRDRRLISNTIFSFFRWYGWTVQKLGLDPLTAGLAGAALDQTELHPTLQYLNEHRENRCPLEPLGGKTLEEKLAVVNEWFKNLPEFQPLEISDLVFPEFGSVVDPDYALKCIREFQRRPPTWLRSRTAPAELLKTLKENQIKPLVHPAIPTALAVPGGTNMTQALPGKVAQYVIQDIASQCVALICAPQKDQEWWDCCAGAGGKTFHLMDLMKQTGKILATDTRVSALKKLKKRARKLGIRNIHTQVHNVIYDPPFTKGFDAVLVDAPCSGWGTWARNPDARWRVSRKDVSQYSHRQVRLLCNASMCVKPGGTLVYSVCTFTRPETEEVIARFQDRNPDFQLTPFPHPLNGSETDGTVQIWPWEGPGDAMFIARFTRQGL